MAFSIRPYRRFPVQCAVSYDPRPFLKLPLAYLLGFWLLITLLFLNSVPAYAKWVAVEETYPGLRTVYVDPDTIRREGNLVTLWLLMDFKWMQGNAGMGHFGLDPSRFLSTKTQMQFDCAEKRLRLLAFTEFSRNMGTGIPADGYVDTGNWVPVKPDSMNQALWEVACGDTK